MSRRPIPDNQPERDFREELVRKHCIKQLTKCDLATKRIKGGCHMSTDRGCSVIEGAMMNHKSTWAMNGYMKRDHSGVWQRKNKEVCDGNK